MSGTQLSAGVDAAGQGGGGDRFRLRYLFTLAPGHKDHRVGLRVALCVLTPLLVLILINRLDLAPFAVFGAFAAVYSRGVNHVERLLMQIRGAGLMWFVVLAAWFTGHFIVQGHVTQAGGIWLVGTTTVVATLASIAAGLMRLRPGGALFSIFAFASVASLPPLAGLGDAMFTTTATMVLALILGQLARVAPSHRTPRELEYASALTRQARTIVFREGAACFVAVALTGAIALLLSSPLGTGHVAWALVAAVVPLVGHSTRHRTIRAVHRALGTAVGLGIMAVVVAVQPQPWLAVIIVAVCQFCAELFVIRNYFWAQVFVTPMALIGVSLSTSPQWSFLYDRAIETVIGLAVGLVVVEVMNRARPPRVADDAPRAARPPIQSPTAPGTNRPGS